MKKFIATLLLLSVSSVTLAGFSLPQKVSYPADGLDVTTNVHISDNGSVNYSNRLSNGNRWTGYHVLTTINLKDSKGNILHTMSNKKGMNAGYMKTEIVIDNYHSSIPPELVPKVDKGASQIIHQRVGGGDRTNEIEKAGKVICNILGC